MMTVEGASYQIVLHDAEIFAQGEFELVLCTERGGAAGAVLWGGYALNGERLRTGGWRAAVPWETDPKNLDFRGPFDLAECIGAGERAADGAIGIGAGRLRGIALAADFFAVAGLRDAGAKLSDVCLGTELNAFATRTSADCGALKLEIQIGGCMTHPGITAFGDLADRFSILRRRDYYGRRLGKLKVLIERKYGTQTWTDLSKRLTNTWGVAMREKGLLIQREDSAEERARLDALLKCETTMCEGISNELRRLDETERKRAAERNAEALADARRLDRRRERMRSSMWSA